MTEAAIIIDLDEIVFEYREKRYGSYVLRKNYPKYLAWSFLIMLSLMTLGIAEYIILNYKKAVNEERIICNDCDGWYDLRNPEKQKLVFPKEYNPNLPISYNQSRKRQSVASKIAHPVPFEIEDIEEADTTIVLNIPEKKLPLKDSIPKTDTIQKIICSLNYTNNNSEEKLVEIQLPPQPTKEINLQGEEPNPTICVWASRQAKVLNLTEIQQKIAYPIEASEKGLAGSFPFKLLIDENGNYIRHISPPDIPFVLCKEVERHIAKIKFSPAIHRSKPIKCWIMVPFVFKLL